MVVHINSLRMEIKNIIFYYPSKITGGAEYLFVRCSDFLVMHQDKYRIYYVDYDDGFARKNLKSKDVGFIECKIGQKTIIPDNSAVIVQLNLISQIDSLFIYNQQQSIFLYWCLHSLNIKSQIYRKGRYFLFRNERKMLGEELSALSEKNVIKYMGYIAYVKVIRDLYQKPQQLEWLPNIAPIDESLPLPEFRQPAANCLRFCWLGRLDEEKAKNVVTYMNELEECNKHYKLSLSLIGIGPAEEYLRKCAQHYSYPIDFVGEKRDLELDAFIRKNTDIGLASGTSAYEFSLRGKPVIMEWVLDRVYEAGERNRYTFTFFEVKDLDKKTGEPVVDGQGPFIMKLEELINNFEEISKECYNFVISKSPSNSVKILLNTIEYISKLDQDEVERHVTSLRRIINKANRRIRLLYRLKHPFSIYP